MDTLISGQALLALVNRPAFCVRDDRVVQTNEAARARLICEGDHISQFMPQIPDAYRELQDGCLFLTVMLQNLPCNACVTRQDTGDLFVLDFETDSAGRSLALAAAQLRQSLNIAYAALEDIPKEMRPNHMTQALSQMHRILCNMSDMARYSDPISARMTATNLAAVFTETMQKGQILLSNAGYYLHFNVPETVIGMADREMVERALWNILSNAAKFSNKGDHLEASMSRSGNLLRFTLRDTGDGVPVEVLQQIYSRYLREPTLEDSRFGVGLGLAIVSAVAGLHGGTVLIDRPKNGGTRVTMTMTITPCPNHTLRSPVNSILGDYSGGFDHGLLELSDVLPADLYTF